MAVHAIVAGRLTLVVYLEEAPERRERAADK
jgi:hypothetical protein